MLGAMGVISHYGNWYNNAGARGEEVASASPLFWLMTDWHTILGDFFGTKKEIKFFGTQKEKNNFSLFVFFHFLVFKIFHLSIQNE